MESGEFFLTITPPPGGGHSDALVAIDTEGNVAAVVHSINTIMWGETGIFVDGISIPDSACFQQLRMEQEGPGNRLSEETNPIVFLEGGQPILASASIGSGLHQRTNSMTWSVLDFGMDVATAQAQPAIGYPELSEFSGPSIREQVRLGDFSAPVLEDARNLGLLIDEVSPLEFSLRGYWVGIQIDDDGALHGVASEELNGAAIGH
jgi:gamma-glutamyltranspeptidase/glutathione hydrolase